MPTFDFTTANASLDDLQQQITAAVKNLRRSKELAGSAQSALAALPTQSQSLATYIDTQAADNPNDEAVQAMKRRFDKMVADFQSRKGTADNMVADLDNYNP